MLRKWISSSKIKVYFISFIFIINIIKYNFFSILKVGIKKLIPTIHRRLFHSQKSHLNTNLRRPYQSLMSAQIVFLPVSLLSTLLLMIMVNMFYEQRVNNQLVTCRREEFDYIVSFIFFFLLKFFILNSIYFALFRNSRVSTIDYKSR
jgi:hypothetical protein